MKHGGILGVEMTCVRLLLLWPQLTRLLSYFQLGSSKDTLVLWLESSKDTAKGSIFGPLLGSILSIKTKKD